MHFVRHICLARTSFSAESIDGCR